MKGIILSLLVMKKDATAAVPTSSHVENVSIGSEATDAASNMDETTAFSVFSRANRFHSFSGSVRGSSVMSNLTLFICQTCRLTRAAADNHSPACSPKAACFLAPSKQPDHIDSIKRRANPAHTNPLPPQSIRLLAQVGKRASAAVRSTACGADRCVGHSRQTSRSAASASAKKAMAHSR